MRFVVKIVDKLFLRKITIAKWRMHALGVFMFSAGIAFSLTYLTNELVLPKLFAATSPWSQTDWSGGTAGGTVTGTVTTYASETNINPSATSFSLDTTEGWAEDYTSWLYRKTITFDNTTANLGVTSEALTDFPVLVKLDSGSDIDYTKTLNAGEDIRFADGDGTALSYEIEKWDETGTSYVWVKVPQIDSDSDEDYIYMYYGNSGATDGQNASGVWDGNYKAVFHMDESSGVTVSDSTTTGLTGNKVSASSPSHTASGYVNGAQSYNNTSDYIDIPNGYTSTVAGQANYAISFWVRPNSTSLGSSKVIFDSINCGSLCFGTQFNTSSGLYWWSGGGVYRTYTGINFVADTWYYITLVRTGSGNTGNLYVNGELKTSFTGTLGSPSSTSSAIRVGHYQSGSWHFGGIIDELRISNTTRSAAWVSASYKSESDDFNTYGSEVNKVASTGTLTSNILDAEFAADWGTLTYTTSGSGTVSVKVRTDSSSDMSGATAWASCSAISSGSDMSSNGCVTDTHQYVQYQVTLTPSGASSPVFEDISLAFTASDQVAPPTNATSVAVTGIGDGDWTNTEPTITWDAGADDGGGGGLLGYCIALDEAEPGSSDELDPELAADMLTAIDDGVSNSSCPYIVTGTSLNLSSVSGLTLTTGKQYYVSIKAVDIAGNVYAGATGSYQDLVSFKYDATNPSNPSFISMPSDFIATKEATLTWPTSGGNAPADSHSGLAGLQYRIGSSGTWYGDSHTGDQDYDDLLENDGSYTFVEDPDFDDIEEGNNLIYLRTWDIAGNVTTTLVSGVLKVNSVAPGVPQNLDVTPEDSDSNEYAFSWEAPSSFTGSESNLTYCYTINTAPTSTSCTFTSAGQTSLSSGAYATQPGTNTLYVVAKDEADNINYDTYASIEFTYSGSAPGIPRNADISDISIKATSNWKLALSWDEPSDTGAGVSTYKVYRSTSAASCSSSFGSFTLVGSTAGTSYTDTGLSQTDYYYCVKACDSANSCGAVSSTVTAYPDGKFTTAASLTSGPTVSSVTTKKATITWSTDRTSDSKIAYGTSSGDYNSEEVSNSDQTTSHTINLTNLKAGTTYHYVAKWTDEDGNLGESDEKSFTTEPAPAVKEATVTDIGVSSAIVTFTASGGTTAKIYYGPSTTFGGLNEVATSTEETTYTIQLVGLEDDTKYFYKINLLDSEDEEYEGDINSFTTLPRPQISNVRIQEVPQAANPTVLVTWNSNTDISSVITYYPEGNPAAAQDEVDVSRVSGIHRMLLRGLLPNQRYVLIAKGVDRVGNEAVSDSQLFTTSTDTRPPVISEMNVEGNVEVAQQSGAGNTVQLIVSWNTDEPSTSQIEYAEGTGTTYSQQSQEDNNLTLNHVVIISGLTPSKVYHLRAISRDSAGNTGKSIDTVTIAPKVTDDALDLVLSNLRETFGFLSVFVK